MACLWIMVKKKVEGWLGSFCFVKKMEECFWRNFFYFIQEITILKTSLLLKGDFNLVYELCKTVFKLAAKQNAFKVLQS